ncbi:hypothetical protein ACFY8W_22630 [Streptomyces sp. NPDC012637]|uniref:hypothetical protein n=1 Tax=Streptomyces sp. NPDC012637 TaxID=3364842 RepID=UPI0036EE8BE7
MIDQDVDELGWELIGWDGDEVAAQIISLTRDEILRLNTLFPERGEDELLAAAVYPIGPESYAAMRAAVPRLEFKADLDYQLGGFRLA